MVLEFFGLFELVKYFIQDIEGEKKEVKFLWQGHVNSHVKNTLFMYSKYILKY